MFRPMSTDRKRRLAGREEKPKNAINRIPGWLRTGLGLPDWLAGSVVVVAGGLLMSLLVLVLILVFPAA